MRRYLKGLLGRTVIVQCWGMAFRGEVAGVPRDGLELVSAAVFDESNSMRRDWVPLDGRVLIPLAHIRYAQVP